MEHSFAGAVAALLITGTIVSGFYALENFLKPKEAESSSEAEVSVSAESKNHMALIIISEAASSVSVKTHKDVIGENRHIRER